MCSLVLIRITIFLALCLLPSTPRRIDDLSGAARAQRRSACDCHRHLDPSQGICAVHLE